MTLRTRTRDVLAFVLAFSLVASGWNLLGGAADPIQNTPRAGSVLRASAGHAVQAISAKDGTGFYIACPIAHGPGAFAECRRAPASPQFVRPSVGLGHSPLGSRPPPRSLNAHL